MTDGQNLGFIDDEYTLPGFIAASAEQPNGMRFWDALEFTYRVATRSEWILLDAKVSKLERDALSNPEAAVKSELEACDFVAKHVKSWNLKNRGGHEVPIDAKSIL